MADQKFKSKIKAQGGIQVPAETTNRALIADASGDVKSSSVTSTELGYLSGVTSAIQTQLDSKASGTDLTDHINDVADAHDASAISNTPSGNLAATDVQGALNELQGDVDSLDSRLDAIEPDIADLITLSGVAANSTTLGTFTGTIIPDNQTIKQAIQALETELEAIPSPFYYAGTWAASTNTPTLANGVGTSGAVYYVTDAGSVDFGAGSIPFAAGDKVAYNGSVWDKWDMTDAVASIFGRTGAVTAQSGDYTASQVTNVPAGNISATDVQAAINELDSEKFASADFNSSFDSRLATKSTTDLAEGTNLYFTNERAQDAIGTILVDSASIDLTYNDATPSITASVIPGGVDHDSLQNFVANEHIDHSTVSIQTAANSGLSGGGDITTNRSLVVDINGTTAETSADDADEILIWDTSASARRKMTRANFLAGVGGASPGDIQETSFSLTNNQASPANVTGLAFAAGVVRGFKALVSVEIDATADLFETFELVGINKGGSFDMAISSVGDESGVAFSITAAGQVQYTSGNQVGFVSGAIKFRAETLSV